VNSRLALRLLQKPMRWLSLIFLVLTPLPALAGKADVIAVKVEAESRATYRFEVTIRSDDTGWDKYADKWEVVSPDGTVLGTRVLAHPHETEQPFTRDLSGVEIPATIKQVRIRAHDSVEGYGGAEVVVTIPPI
jgi:hypothetical protein